MATIPIVEYLTSLWNNFLITFVGQKMVFDIRHRLYEQLMRLSLRYHEKKGTGAIISRLMGDSATIQNMVTWNTISLLNDLISFCVGIVVVFSLSWKLALATFAILPLHALNYFIFVKRIRKKTGRIRTKWDRIYNQAYERLKGARLVRAFGKERIEAGRFVMETSDMMDLNIGNVALTSSFNGMSGLIDGIGNAIIFCLGCFFVIRGEMTYGSVAAFMAYAWRVLGPVFQFTGISNQIEQTLVSADRIFEIMDTHPEIQDREDAKELPKVSGEVCFENVNFEYDKGVPVLRDINLRISAGTTVALVGHTGCGKTTLTSLLLRYYDTISGRITIDGHDISRVTVSSLRLQIGQVLQDSILFDESTIGENIAYGKKNVTEEQIAEAAKVGEIHDFILALPNGYGEKIGGDGIKLSVGEKQRICIARAILSDPSILVLDEATSSLDSNSEVMIQKAMENVLKSRTSFVVAHRLSTIVNADLIIVMDKGRIVEKGNHQELLELNGLYKHLYEEQFAEA